MKHLTTLMVTVHIDQEGLNAEDLDRLSVAVRDELEFAQDAMRACVRNVLPDKRRFRIEVS